MGGGCLPSINLTCGLSLSTALTAVKIFAGSTSAWLIVPPLKAVQVPPPAVVGLQAQLHSLSMRFASDLIQYIVAPLSKVGLPLPMTSSASAAAAPIYRTAACKVPIPACSGDWTHRPERRDRSTAALIDALPHLIEADVVAPARLDGRGVPVAVDWLIPSTASQIGPDVKLG